MNDASDAWPKQSHRRASESDFSLFMPDMNGIMDWINVAVVLLDLYLFVAPLFATCRIAAERGGNRNLILGHKKFVDC